MFSDSPVLLRSRPAPTGSASCSCSTAHSKRDRDGGLDLVALSLNRVMRNV